MKPFSLLLLLLCGFSAAAQTQVQFHTSMGSFRVELREDLMPITANNIFNQITKGILVN